ncbi:hypothetical protein [Candidatus Doolittlea endobia]|uniref:hypothetical protein n=1 Tax=Candidatus Doolittlea endobia TaxID=1778262 RepID=UPI0013158791|nr:hypothetical protein [Candidatus Doolittlea endobia]
MKDRKQHSLRINTQERQPIITENIVLTVDLGNVNDGASIFLTDKVKTSQACRE